MKTANRVQEGEVYTREEINNLGIAYTGKNHHDFWIFARGNYRFALTQVDDNKFFVRLVYEFDKSASKS